MYLIDDLRAPSGREQITLRPAWRLRRDDGVVFWAFVQEQEGKIWITGYPQYHVEQTHSQPNAVTGAFVGAGAGAAVGGAIGGPPGALLGGLLGLLLGASSGSNERS